MDWHSMSDSVATAFDAFSEANVEGGRSGGGLSYPRYVTLERELPTYEAPTAYWQEQVRREQGLQETRSASLRRGLDQVAAQEQITEEELQQLKYKLSILQDREREKMAAQQQQQQQQQQGMPQQREKFFQSVVWLSVKSVITVFFTTEILELVLAWRSGFDILVLMIIIAVFWWVFLQNAATKWLVSDQDVNTTWQVTVYTTVQTITMSLTIITAQYAIRLVFLAWQTQSQSGLDDLSNLAVIAFLSTIFVVTTYESENLSAEDISNENLPV